MMTITGYDIVNKYDSTGAVLLDLDPLEQAETAAELRRDMRQMERIRPDLEKRRILEMAARLHLPAEGQRE